MIKQGISNKIKVLVLGVNGMLGHKVFEILSKEDKLYVTGTVTDIKKAEAFFPNDCRRMIRSGVFADKLESVECVLNDLQPEIVVNCIGIIKQNDKSHDLQRMISVNALFPHQLAKTTESYGGRVITIATDCVFDGQKETAYVETDLPTCHDAYGMSKYLGELQNGRHLTIRTSIIGHELNSNLSLVDWFLSQTSNSVSGYSKAIFSGLTTLEFAKFLLTKVIFNTELMGLYHLSVEPIAKLDLLNLIKNKYQKEIEILPDTKVVINRALNSDKLREKVNYQPPTWEQLIAEMHADYLKSPFYINKRKSA